MCWDGKKKNVIVHRISEKDGAIPRINVMISQQGDNTLYRLTALLYDQSKNFNSKHCCERCLHGYITKYLLERQKPKCAGQLKRLISICSVLQEFAEKDPMLPTAKRPKSHSKNICISHAGSLTKSSEATDTFGAGSIQRGRRSIHLARRHPGRRKEDAGVHGGKKAATNDT